MSTYNVFFRGEIRKCLPDTTSYPEPCLNADTLLSGKLMKGTVRGNIYVKSVLSLPKRFELVYFQQQGVWLVIIITRFH